MTAWLKPTSRTVHPDVDADYEQLLQGPESFRFQVGSGWEMAYHAWLQEGLPAESFGRPNEASGYRLCVMDAFDCTFLLGWCESERRMALFAVSRQQPNEPRETVIDRFRARIETIPCPK